MRAGSTKNQTQAPGLTRPHKLTGIFALMILFSCFCLSVAAEERDEYAMLNISVGQIGVLDDLSTDSFGLEYRFTAFTGPHDIRLIPAIGATIASNGSHYIYAGLAYDFYINSRWLLVPSFVLGKYKQSVEINLGNDLEFKSGIEVAYQFENKYRAGVAFFHISNGGISESNSGTEILAFSVSIPVM